MKPLFAILICTLTERRRLLDRLLEQLDKQRADHDCIIITNEDQGQKTTGQKRNELKEEAIRQNATHISYFDDDDLPGPRYVELNMNAVNGNYDTASLWGQYYEHGKQLNPFHHSLKYDHWWQDDKYYYRCNNHLNLMKLSMVKDIPFPEQNFGEDGVNSLAIQKAGVLKTEYQIDEIVYFYFHGKRNYNQEPAMALKRGTKL